MFGPFVASPTWGLVLLLTLPGWTRAQVGGVTTAGERLARTLDRMKVEHLWLPGKYVQWKTGEPSDKRIPGVGRSTHCSAFVAAVCAQLGVYVLRPPEHAQILLANAQYDWLLREGPRRGWERVKLPEQAQRLANEGVLVLASYRNADVRKPGHIALVRPCAKTTERIEQEGPQIIQAGRTNAASISLREGFKNHPGAFEQREILFFAHPAQLP